MPKTKEISVDLRNEIVEAHKGGKGYRVIGNMFHIPTSTVGSIIRKWKEYQTTENLPRTGAPKKISTRALNHITRIVSKKPQTTRKELVEELEAVGTSVSKHTVSNALRERGLRSSKARKVPLLSKRHIEARKIFATTFITKPEDYWYSVLWSDETKIELFNHCYRRQVWRKRKEAFNPKNTIPTVKFGGGSIMVWGCFSGNGTGCLQIIKGRMNGAMYRDILSENLIRSVEMLQLGQNFVFQQDNDPKHTAKATSKWFEDNNVAILPWPSQSPDLNPIENLWKELKIRVSKRQPRNLKDLETFCTEEWANISPSYPVPKPNYWIQKTASYML